MSPQARAGYTVDWGVDLLPDLPSDPENPTGSRRTPYYCYVSIRNFATPITAVRPWCPCAQEELPLCLRHNGASTSTFTSTGAPKGIPDDDATGATSTIEVPAGFDVKRVLVSVNITHTWRGDLEISVIAPNGQAVMLSNRDGSQNDNFIVVNRDITGSFAVGSWGPGAWRLLVRDLAQGDTGAINSFSLQITPPTDTVTTVATEPGQRKPSVGAPSSGSNRRDFVSPPTCLTYDDLPATSPTEVQEKFERLWSSYEGPVPTTVPAATFKQAIVNRLKLMYELWGEQLRNEHNATDQAHRSAALYTTFPDDNPSCVSDIDAPLPEAACTSPAVITKRGELIRCQRLLGQHASEGVASLVIDDCATLLSGYLDLAEQPAADNACGGEHLREIATKALFQLEDKQLGVIVSAPTTIGGLPRQLWLLDRWYAASKRADELGVFAAAEQQRRDTSYLIGRFWDRVRVNSGADRSLATLSRSSSPQEAEAAVGASAVASRQSEQSVVTALFRVPGTIQPEDVTLGRPPLRGLPLLAMLGDALTPFVDDLDGLAIFHDMACQFRECRTPSVNSPSRSAWNILANLESSSLGTTVSVSPTELAGWKPVFTALASQQAAFTQAVGAAMTGSGGLAGATTDEVVHPLARSLWRLYQHARAFHDHYEATGLFEASSQPVIQGSLLETDQSNVVNRLRERVGRLQGRVRDYQDGLVTAVRAQLDVMSTGAQIRNLTAQRLRKVTEMEQKAANLEGLRASGEDEDDAFGSLAKSFLDIQAALDSGAFVDVGDTARFELNGQSGRFTHSRAPADVAVHTIQNLSRGQMLAVTTSNVWTPTCSIQAEKFLRDDGGDPIDANLSDAQIGPEGYTLSISGSTVSVHSAGHAWGLEATVGASAQYCQTSGILGGLGFKGEACVFASASASRSNTWTGSNGNESRTTAAFSTGIRLDSTPFPEAPAGSLLVVLTDPVTGEVHEVRVIHSGGTSILIEDPSTAYFVVNDKQCTTAATEHVLGVAVRIAGGAIPVAEQALKAMVEVIGYMQEKQHEWAQQGTLLPSQGLLLREQANFLLQAKLRDIDISELPAPLASLFSAFVSHQVVATERRIEISAVRRSLDLDLIELRAIDDELTAGAAHARLQRLIPQWIIRDLDHDTLRDSLVDVLSISRDFLKPILELWYPHALNSDSVETQIRALRDVEVDASLVTLATDGQNFVTALLDAYEHGSFGAKGNSEQLPIVVVSFPRPSAAHTNVFWREADAARSTRVWDAIDHQAVAHFEITPEDIYSRNGGRAILSCNEVVPLIKTMALFVVRPGLESSNGTLNGAALTFQSFGGANQSFVAPAGPRVYQLVDWMSAAPSVWQSFMVPVWYGESEAAVSTFGNMPRRSRPVGLSATGAFDIDFSILRELVDEAGFTVDGSPVVTEVQLIMELDSRAVGIGDRPAWISRCR